MTARRLNKIPQDAALKGQGEELDLSEAATRLRMTIAFDGLAYQGWQWQRVGVGVQEKIQEAFQKVFGVALQVHSSSRTDTGVHALGMVAHVDIPRTHQKMRPEKVLLAINAHLPEDIRIMEVRVVPQSFHARFSASGKQYRYSVWSHRCHHPLWRGTSWHVPQALDLLAMRTAAKLLVGTHDFRAFAVNTPYRKKNTIRTLTRCSIQRSGSMFTFVIEGNGFLYKMCRGLVGTLVQIGQGKYAAQDIIRMIECEDRRVAGMTAPARGLVLWKVYYKKKKNAVVNPVNPEMEGE